MNLLRYALVFLLLDSTYLCGMAQDHNETLIAVGSATRHEHGGVTVLTLRDSALQSTVNRRITITSNSIKLHEQDEPLLHCELSSLVFSGDQSKLAAGRTDGTIAIFDLSQDKLVRQEKKHDNTVVSLASSRDGLLTVSGSSDKTLRIWSWNSPENIVYGIFDPQPHNHARCECDSSFQSILITPDEHRIIECSLCTRRIAIWEFRKLQNMKRLHHLACEGAITALAVSCDGKKIASGSDNGKITFWNIETGNMLFTLAPRMVTDQELNGCLIDGAPSPRIAGVSSLAFSPDGLFMAFGTRDGNIGLYDMNRLALQYIHKLGDFPVDRLFFSQTNNSLIAGFSNQIVQFFDVRTRRVFYGLVEVTALAVSYNGKNALTLDNIPL